MSRLIWARSGGQTIAMPSAEFSTSLTGLQSGSAFDFELGPNRRFAEILSWLKSGLEMVLMTRNETPNQIETPR